MTRLGLSTSHSIFFEFWKKRKICILELSIPYSSYGNSVVTFDCYTVLHCQATWLYEDDEALTGLSAVLNSDFGSLPDDSSTSYTACQVLSTLTVVHTGPMYMLWPVLSACKDCCWNSTHHVKFVIKRLTRYHQERRPASKKFLRQQTQKTTKSCRSRIFFLTIFFLNKTEVRNFESMMYTAEVAVA